SEYSVPIYRITLVREGEQAVAARRVSNPGDVVSIVREYLGEPDREVMVALMLSTKCDLIGINTVSVGTLDSALVHPREVFKPAILLNAASVIVAHNHPSGDATPSAEDRRTSERLADAGKVLGIELCDHIVIGNGVHTSLKERGVI